MYDLRVYLLGLPYHLSRLLAVLSIEVLIEHFDALIRYFHKKSRHSSIRRAHLANRYPCRHQEGRQHQDAYLILRDHTEEPSFHQYLIALV